MNINDNSERARFKELTILWYDKALYKATCCFQPKADSFPNEGASLKLFIPSNLLTITLFQ